MKQTWLRIAKALLVLCFLYHLGFFDFMVSSFIASAKMESGPRMTMEEERVANARMHQRLKDAQANPNYRARDYFKDLGEMRRLKEDQIPFSTNITANLQMIIQSRCSWEEIHRESDIFTGKETPFTDAPVMLWGKVGTWCVDAYFHCLPWTGLLFLIWRLQGRSKKYFASPLSFCLALLAYPAVIAYSVYLRIHLSNREFRAAAELIRRKDKIFTLLSEDELESIRQFAKSKLPLAAWRTKLHNQGMQVRHSLAFSLLVGFVLLTLAPVAQSAPGKQLFQAPSGIQTISLTHDNHSPPGDEFHDPPDMACPIDDWLRLQLRVIQEVSIYFSCKVLSGFQKIPDPIPLF